MNLHGASRPSCGPSGRMKTIALINTRSEVPGETLGILVSTHPNVMAAFVANDAFQKAEGGGRHIRTKISPSLA